ncbi:MAG: histidine kinase [Vicinamibacteraceae bacterium]
MRRSWLVAACCFTLAAILFTGQVWVDYAYAGRSLSWPRAFAVALVDWELWTLIAPIILLLGARVPVSRRRLAKPLVVHIPASLGIAVVKLAAEAMIVRAIIGPGRVPFSLLKIHLTLLTYWAIVGAVQYAEQHRLARERELQAARLQTELARAQVEALKMQIHPHFLFNTLNAIAGLMREDVESADVMLAQLGELLRGTLQTEGVQEVPLADELRLLRIYLAIQQTRYGDRLRIDVDLAAGCEASLVPTLILQPLVENAIRHGFSVTPGPGAVGIRVSCAQGTLRIDVTDEGPGPPQPLRDGYGLRNTRSRLRALYGDGASLSVGPDARRGARARLELPLRLAASS